MAITSPSSSTIKLPPFPPSSLLPSFIPGLKFDPILRRKKADIKLLKCPLQVGDRNKNRNMGTFSKLTLENPDTIHPEGLFEFSSSWPLLARLFAFFSFFFFGTMVGEGVISPGHCVARIALSRADANIYLFRCYCWSWTGL